jgi:hypothetical protein
VVVVLNLPQILLEPVVLVAVEKAAIKVLLLSLVL